MFEEDREGGPTLGPLLTFDIVAGEQLFEIARRRLSELEFDRDSAEKAIIAAVLLWSSLEWILKEQHIDDELGYKSARKSLEEGNASIAILRDLADGLKHRTLDRKKITVVRTWIHRGTMSKQDFHPDDFDVPRGNVGTSSGASDVYVALLAASEVIGTILKDSDG